MRVPPSTSATETERDWGSIRSAPHRLLTLSLPAYPRSL
jgi:hypothetical protein